MREYEGYLHAHLADINNLLLLVLVHVPSHLRGTVPHDRQGSMMMTRRTMNVVELDVAVDVSVQRNNRMRGGVVSIDLTLHC